MSEHGIYHTTKIIPLARSVLKVMALSDLRVQQKIMHAISRIPLCEFYLSDLGIEIPRPSWIARKNIDLRNFARGKATYEEKIAICEMAPQHKGIFVNDLVDWWATALVDAGCYRGESLGSFGRKAA